MTSIRRHDPVRSLVVLLGAVLALIAVQVFAGATDANATFKVYTATVTPQSATAGAPVTLTFTVKNAATSIYQIGSTQVAVPDGYSNVTLGSATTSTGKSWAMRFGTCQSGSPAPCPTAGTRLVEADAVRTDGTDLLGAGQSVTFKVSATAPLAAGSTTWNTAAKTSRDFSGTTTFVLSGAQPVVTVTAAPATQLSAAADTTSEAGSTLGVTVSALTATGEVATTFNQSATVTSSDPKASLPGNVAFTAGVTSFTVSLKTAGPQTITTAAGGLTTTVQLTVGPAGPSALLLTSSPVGSVPAGPLSPVVVAVTDLYGNQTTGTAITVAVDAPGSGLTGTTTRTSNNGSVSFDDLSVPRSGSYTLSATAAGLTGASTPLVVVAATASRLVIDSVVGTAGAGQPVEGQSTTVSVRSEDEFGNAAPVTADTQVSLTTDGRSLGGTTTGTIPAGQSGTTIVGATYPVYENQVTFKASAAQFVSGTRLVDVQAIGVFQQVTPGVAATLQNPKCVDATPAVPTCSTFVLPKGATGTAYLTQGACNLITPCRVSTTTGVSALLVSAKANFKNAQGQPLYSRSSPATVIVRCDKTLCTGTAIKGYPLFVDGTDNGNFVSAPACPSKGKIASTGPAFCIDNVQSKRDNAGDLVQYLLIAEDPRIAPRGT